MATTNVTMRMGEDLKEQLQELVSNLGTDGYSQCGDNTCH